MTDLQLNRRTHFPAVSGPLAVAQDQVSILAERRSAVDETVS
jgi:hypothetical protein